MKMNEDDQQQSEDQKYYYMATSPLMKSSSETTTPERTGSTGTTPSSSEPLSSCHSPTSYNSYHASTTFEINEDGDPRTGRNKKVVRKAHSFAYRIRDHVKMGPKLSETVKGKLSLGARIIQQGGRENIFKNVFGIRSSDGEKLLKASQCYLSTTAGPIAGILFISTHKIAFCSERSITLPIPSNSTSGEVVRTPYKVSIPIKKIKRANESENVNKPEQKFIEIVTEDNFEFWFMGFVRFEKAFINIQKAISMSGV